MEKGFVSAPMSSYAGTGALLPQEGGAPRGTHVEICARRVGLSPSPAAPRQTRLPPSSLLLGALYWLISDHSPQLKRMLHYWGYEYLARRFAHEDWTFMNFGYAAVEDAAPPTLWSSDEPDRLHIQLYHRVIAAVPLEGRDVLEIGCGRGGGASYIARYLHPRTMVGIDFSTRVIAFCQRRHAVPGLRFCLGDAVIVPLEDSSFDAVINVESSHSYTSMPRFLKQVRRVLRPGGHFMFTDLRLRHQLPQVIEHLSTSRMFIVESEDITRNVVQSLDLDSARKRDAIQRRAPHALRGILSWFAGVKGTRNYQALCDGNAVYVRYLLRKPDASTDAIRTAAEPSGRA